MTDAEEVRLSNAAALRVVHVIGEAGHRAERQLPGTESRTTDHDRMNGKLEPGHSGQPGEISSLPEVVTLSREPPGMPDIASAPRRKIAPSRPRWVTQS